MSNAKHTPGPWEAIGNLVRSPMHQPEGLPRGVIVAECRDGYFLPHTDEAKANARLIAAAPELLEATLIALSFNLEHGEVVFSGGGMNAIDEMNAATAKLRSAIAKATGSAS